MALPEHVEFPDLVVEPRGLKGRDAPRFLQIATSAATITSDEGPMQALHWLYGLDKSGRVYYWENTQGWCELSPIAPA